MDVVSNRIYKFNTEVFLCLYFSYQEDQGYQDVVFQERNSVNSMQQVFLIAVLFSLNLEALAIALVLVFIRHFTFSTF